MALLLLLLLMLHYLKTTNEPITVVVSKSLLHVGKRKTSPHRQKISIFSLSFFCFVPVPKTDFKTQFWVNGYSRETKFTRAASAQRLQRLPWHPETPKPRRERRRRNDRQRSGLRSGQGEKDPARESEEEHGR